MTHLTPSALLELRDEVAELRAESKKTNKRVSQVEATVLEGERHQRIIIGKLEEVLQALREAFVHGRKR